MGWGKGSCSNWSQSTYHVLRFYYTNDTGVEKRINSITCRLGTGKGSVYSSGGTKYTGYGNSLTASLKCYYTDSSYGTNSKLANSNTKVVSTATVTEPVDAEVTLADGPHYRTVNNINYTMSKNNKFDKYFVPDESTSILKDKDGNNITVDETGYFSNVGSDHKVTFTLSSPIKVANGVTFYFAVYKSSSDNIISSRGCTASNISGVIVDKPKCTGTVSIPTNVLKGTSITATVSGTINGSSILYKWYNANGTQIPGQTSATLAADKVATGVYCTVTISKTDYTSCTDTSKSVTVYTKITSPTDLIITGSKADGRYTDRESYTFSWSGAKNGTNNNITKYRWWLYKNGSQISGLTGTTTSTSLSKSYSAAELGISRGDTLTLWVRAEGKYSDGYGADVSKTVTIVSSALVHIKVGSEWKDGIVHINTGTSEKPNWVEAQEVNIKIGNSWETSV